jgi:hypothetical protein
MSSTTRSGESMASTLPIRSRLIRAKAAKFPSSASISVSKDCNREVSAAPRSGDLLRADQPEGGILAQPLGVIDILVTGQPAVDGLPKQIGQRKLGVLAAAGVAQMLFDELSQAEPFVQLPHQNQAPSEVTRDPWKSIFKAALKES